MLFPRYRNVCSLNVRISSPGVNANDPIAQTAWPIEPASHFLDKKKPAKRQVSFCQ